MSQFDIGEYMRGVRSYTRPLRNRDKQRIRSAFPNAQAGNDKLRGTMMVKFDYRDFRRLLEMATEGELREMFGEAGKDAGRKGITLVKQKLKSGDPNYNKKNPGIRNQHVNNRLKRKSSGRSIYRYVADHLNFYFNEKSGVIAGFVGEDVRTPLLGSRGWNLPWLVEGRSKATAKAPVNMNVMPSIGYSSGPDYFGDKVFFEVRRRRSKYGPTPNPLKAPGGIVKMRPVMSPDPIPFLEYWQNKTLQMIFDKFMKNVGSQQARRFG